MNESPKLKRNSYQINESNDFLKPKVVIQPGIRECEVFHFIL